MNGYDSIAAKSQCVGDIAIIIIIITIIFLGYSTTDMII